MSGYSYQHSIKRCLQRNECINWPHSMLIFCSAEWFCAVFERAVLSSWSLFFFLFRKFKKRKHKDFVYVCECNINSKRSLGENVNA